MHYSLPGSSVHGIFLARIQEWVTISLSRGSSWPRDWTWVSCIAGRLFTIWATREASYNVLHCFSYYSGDSFGWPRGNLCKLRIFSLASMSPTPITSFFYCTPVKEQVIIFGWRVISWMGTKLEMSSSLLRCFSCKILNIPFGNQNRFKTNVFPKVRGDLS